VLADRCGCRSRRAALGPCRKGSGSSLWLPRSGVRAPAAKRRRKPVRGGESHEHASSESGGGLLVIPRADAQASACSGEGALGDGRRPGPVQANVFDETAAEPGRRSRRRGCGSDAGSAIRRGRDRGRQRLRHELGTRSKTPRPGGAARRSRRSGLRQDRAPPHTPRTRSAPVPRHRARLRTMSGTMTTMVVTKAEAGGSPSSEAPPGWLTGRETPQGGARSEAPPGIGRFAGCSLRESVAEVGETHLSRGVTEPSEDGPRSREIARGDPPAFDEADQGSQRATGCGARQRT